MIDHARSKMGPVERIDWRPADAASLPFASGSFFALTCQFGLMFVPDKQAARGAASPRRHCARGCRLTATATRVCR
jgi:ubiquinone/menaquinone biosynthesis C-methylase UbiE